MLSRPGARIHFIVALRQEDLDRGMISRDAGTFGGEARFRPLMRRRRLCRVRAAGISVSGAGSVARQIIRKRPGGIGGMLAETFIGRFLCPA